MIIQIVWIWGILLWIWLIWLFLYDRFFQTKNLVYANFPIIGRMRYFFEELRPFMRQYFWDDNAFVPRIIIDWILHVSSGKSGYFSYDKFDTTQALHNGKHQLIHSPNPYNKDEMKPSFPLVWEKRKHPLQFHSYFYRSAMSLGAIWFEATAAMASACVKVKAPFNTGEGGLSIHHIPNVVFQYQKFFKYHKVPEYWKIIYNILPAKRLKNDFIDFLWKLYCEKNKRDLYLFDEKEFLFYVIDWTAPLEYFPQIHDLDESYGSLIFQLGSGLYGLRKKNSYWDYELDFERFKKIMAFCRWVEIKLSQWAKQTWGILKAVKNTPTVAEIRWVEPWQDLISPNRFLYYEKGKEKEFIDFIEELSYQSGGKPVWIKTVISDKWSIEPLVKVLAHNHKKWPDWITIDGWDGGSWTAPISLGIIFGHTIFEALKITNDILHTYGIRDKIKVFASSKLYAPHMSARAMAFGADAIGNARSIMIAWGCIRAWLCSGEFWNCPVWLATFKKQNRKAYAQSFEKKVEQISNYIRAHNKWIIEVASIAGIKSPSELNMSHVMKMISKDIDK